MVNGIKKIICNILSFFGSDISLAQISGRYKGASVLLIGDGISQIYAIDKLRDYDYVIAVNHSSLVNHYLATKKQVCHIMMEPSISTQIIKASIFSKPQNKWIRSISKRFQGDNLGFLVLHPYGAIFKKVLFSGRKILFCSPYSKVQSGAGTTYCDFTAAFQASIGMAIVMGFKNLDIVGFDAWLLTPKNPARWYSNISDPRRVDTEENSTTPPEFLSIAAGCCNLRTFTYGHYSSRYSFIEPINVFKSGDAYSPKKNRQEYMLSEVYKELDDWEKFNFPDGYECKRRN